MQLVDLAVYPLKSARGIRVPAAEVEPRGLRGDRRWMIVDANSRCVTQREIPALARLQASPAGEPDATGMRLSLDGRTIDVPCPGMDAAREPVRVWDDTLRLPEARSAAPWLSEVLGQTVRLFHQPDDVRRPVEHWAREDDHVSLADGFPILLATPASLDAVRRAAGASFGMERFRPNLVIEGAPAWAEDGWAVLRVGSIVLDLVKPCARCKLTTVDQESGEFAGDEPLATLRRTRMSGDRRVPGVLFGWNAVARSFGPIRVGDEVEVLEARAAWPVLPERLSTPGLP